jgi:hypothetical protein
MGNECYGKILFLFCLDDRALIQKLKTVEF